MEEKQSGVCDYFQFDINASQVNKCKNCDFLKKEHLTGSQSKKASFSGETGRNSIRNAQDQLIKQLKQQPESGIKKGQQEELEQLRQQMKGGLQDILDKLSSHHQEELLNNVRYATAQELEQLKQHMEGNITLNIQKLKDMQDKWAQEATRDKPHINKLDANLTSKYHFHPPSTQPPRKSLRNWNTHSQPQHPSFYSSAEITSNDITFLQAEISQFKLNIDKRIYDLQNDQIMNYDLQIQVNNALEQLKEMTNKAKS